MIYLCFYFWLDKIKLFLRYVFFPFIVQFCTLFQSISIYLDYLRNDNAITFVPLDKLHVGHCSIVRRICDIYFAERGTG